MSFTRDGYFYDQQLKSYILQFMAIFTGLQVQIGRWNDREERLISVPIHYGSPDRVTAAILADNTQNKPLRLPVLSAYMRNVDIDKARMVGTGTERRSAFVPMGGLVPDDIQVIHQRRPVPYSLELELGIYASNTDQQFQILEQILPLFDPQLTIQTTDSLYDWTRLTSVELQRVNNDTAYPIGTDRRIIQSTLSFSMPIYMDIPAEVRRDFINKIFVRIAAVDTAATDSFEIIGDIDAQGIPYNLVMDGNTTGLS